MAGTWTLYNWLFKPPVGPQYDADFGTAFDNVDAQLQLLTQVQSFYKLRVYNNAVVPATRIDITADMVTMLDTSNNPKTVRNFSKTVNCGTTGANALDTGVLAVGWYCFYCIAKVDGTTAGLASLSATAPTMPTGYVYKKLVSRIYYIAGISNTFVTIQQFDRRVVYPSINIVASASGVAPVSVNLSTVATGGLPVGTLTARFYIYSTNSGNAPAMYVAWDGAGTNKKGLTALFDVTLSPVGMIDYLLNPSTPQTIYVNSLVGRDGALYLDSYELDI